MPLYEFECETCGTRTEVLQRFEDPPPAACAACGGPLKKLFSAPAVHFKGSGWYVTDYAGKGARPASEPGGDSGKKDAAKSSESGASAAAEKGGAVGGESGAAGAPRRMPAQRRHPVPRRRPRRPSRPTEPACRRPGPAPWIRAIS